jgi:hypothetical protein
MRRILMLLATMVMGVLVAGGVALAADGVCRPSGSNVTCTFTYTGNAQSWTVPEGVTQATFDVSGAQGGGTPDFDNDFSNQFFPGGKGGEATATITVTPGEMLQVNVGGKGHNGADFDGGAAGGAGGFNGGAAGGDGFYYGPGGGGGASDVRRDTDASGDFALAERIIVAGGGGGKGGSAGGAGGVGGGLSGGDGGAGASTAVAVAAGGGGGGTQEDGGDGGLGQVFRPLGSPHVPAGDNGSKGDLGDGGDGGDGIAPPTHPDGDGGGGGGGGYYGGGGGGGGLRGGGGGGGSGFGPSGVVFQSGVRSDFGLVTITYTPAVNDAPVNTVPGDQSTDEDTALTFNSDNTNLISISDVDAGTSPVKVTLAVSHGTLTLSGTSGLTFATGSSNGTANMTFTGTIASINSALSGLQFDPDANYNGPAALSITTDDQGNTGTGGAKSDTDTVNITVKPVNATPQAADDTTTYTMAEDSNAITIDFGALVSDVETSDNANLTYNMTAPPAVQGSISGTGSTRTFDSADDFNGSVDIFYTVTDRGDPDDCGTPNTTSCDAAETSLQKKVTVTVTPDNDAPVADDDSTTWSMDEDAAAISVDLRTLVSDVETSDNANLTYNIVSGPDSAKGTLNSTATNGVYSFDSANDFNGQVSFTYKVTDRGDPHNCGTPSTSCAAAKESATKTVTVTVKTVNDPPTVFVAAGGSCGTNDRSGTINLTVNDPDGPEGSLTLGATSSNPRLVPTPSNVTFGGAGATRTLTATAVSGRTGTAVLTVTVTDGQPPEGAPLTVNVRVGGNGNDTLVGDANSDILLGQNGDDTLGGAEGKDLLCGARGNDRLTGGAEADRFEGGLGTDTATDFTAGQGDTMAGIP